VTKALLVWPSASEMSPLAPGRTANIGRLVSPCDPDPTKRRPSPATAVGVAGVMPFIRHSSRPSVP
jgi:hypothetical protein